MKFFTRTLLMTSLLTSSMAIANTQTIKELLSGVKLIESSDVMRHLEKLQQISDENNNNRSSSTSGHELSANYIAQQLLNAGYDVKFKPYTYISYEQIGSADFSQILPTPTNYTEEDEFKIMPYSAGSKVEALVTSVDLDLGLGNNSTSGCEEEDFKDFPVGHIALLQRGACTFATKALNAQKAGAVGAIIFNQGNEESRKEIFAGTLGNDTNAKITVVTASYELGENLAKSEGLQVSITADTKVFDATSYNVLAETKSGNPNNIVMLGSHLDGVAEGPGINDNGSGSSGILEVALRMAKLDINNKVRFAWWGSEELGLIGSRKYVENLSDEEKSKIRLYLNYDMIGSPNYMIGVFDGNGSLDPEKKAPKGSYAIEKLVRNYFDFNQQNHIEIASSGRSDYAAFAEVGIPYGGLFTGAEGEKTQEQADLFGGDAGAPYDACYHKECDNLDNINEQALEINVNAIAFAALSFAHSTEIVEAEQAAPEVETDILADNSDGGHITSDIGHDNHHLEEE